MSRELLLKSGLVDTVDDKLGDLQEADVLIGDSLIVAVAPALSTSTSDAEVIDCKGRLAIPRLFAHDLATDEIELLYCTQGPYAGAANNEQITHAAWRDKRSWFVMGEQDYMLTIDLERDTAKRITAHAVVLQSGHVLMISHPGEVAHFTEEAANELR
jgi:pimeloyl-ACP methyl ester carboxylesterase